MQGTSYEPFSQAPEYIGLNRDFIKSLDFAGCCTVVDLACGTGMLTETILQVGPMARVVGIDIDREQLLLASRHLPDATGSRAVWVQASADTLPLPDGLADAAVMGNAIHNLPDGARLIREIGRVLRPGGRFSFSTSFYAGTFAAGTEGFYLAWMKAALKRLRGAGGGAPALARVRGTVPHASSRPWLSAADYRTLLEENGFAWEKDHERPVAMTQRSFETVGAYSGLARVLLSGYPVERACEALSSAAQEALQSCNLTVVPRLWLEVSAVRR